MANSSNIKTKLSISLLSWAYNEEVNIANFIERAFALLKNLTDDYELILINDASTDRTLEIASSYQKQYPQLKIISNKRNMGCGMNARIAFKEASKDILFWQTVDWSYNLVNINEVISYFESKSIDVVLGVRVRYNSSNVENAPRKAGLFKHIEIKNRSDNFKKIFISMVNYALLRVLFRLPLNDFQNVMFFRTSLMQSLALESSSSFLGIECLLKSYWKSSVIKEIPIPFIPRKLGKSQGTRFRAIYRSLVNIAKFWFKFVVLKSHQDNGNGIIIPYNKNLSPVDIADLKINRVSGVVYSVEKALKTKKSKKAII